jgi:DNA-binding response OmpR family regulator
MTAATTDAGRENRLEAGMGGVLTKPVNVAGLILRVEAAAAVAERS